MKAPMIEDLPIVDNNFKNVSLFGRANDESTTIVFVDTLSLGTLQLMECNISIRL